MKPRFVVVSLFLPTLTVLASVSIASAQEPERQIRVDEQIVVTADREAEPVGDVGSSVTVIGAEQIAASGARWLIDVLQFAPGVNVDRSGPPGTLTEIYLRGASSGHTLVLIDGVKVNSPTSGGYDAANLQLSADQIERIEIVRGPQSTLYGSQAIGGVINVITRRGQGAGSWAMAVEAGSYGTARVHTSFNGEVTGLRYDGSVSFFDTDGFSAADAANGNSEADAYRNVAYNARVDYEADNGARARGFVRGFDGEVAFDGFNFTEGPVDAVRDMQDTRELYAGGAAGFLGDRYATEVQVSVSDVVSESLTPDGFFTGFFLDSAIWEVDWQNNLAVAGDQQLVAGLEYRREQATISSASIFGTDGYDERVDVAGVYAQDRIRLGRHGQVVAGFRYEDHSVYGGTWTGRATTSIDVSDRVRAHGSVGSAFKAPTLNDLYFPGFSNPDLEPEESVGVDVGVEVSGQRGRFDLTYFRNDITNLIQFDAVAGVPANFGEVLAQGVELAGEAGLGPALALAANYTFTRALPDGSDEQLIRRPRHQGGARLTWLARADLRTWGEVRFKTGRFDTGVSGRVPMDPFAIVNLAADYRISPQLLVRGRIDNLLDTEYQEVIGYGTAGISGYVGLTVTLARR